MMKINVGKLKQLLEKYNDDVMVGMEMFYEGREGNEVMVEEQGIEIELKDGILMLQGWE